MNEPDKQDIQGWIKYQEYWETLKENRRKERDSAQRRFFYAGIKKSICKAHIEHLQRVRNNPTTLRTILNFFL